MQVILAALLAPGPGTAAEDAAPVGGRAAVGLRVPPYIPVGFRVRAALPGLQEPGVSPPGSHDEFIIV